MKRIKSPHSGKSLEETHGGELEAWAAAELDGFSGVAKVAGEFRGAKGVDRGGVAISRRVPRYAGDRDAFKRVAMSVLAPGRKLVIVKNGNRVDVDSADAEQLQVGLRALILESMKRRGAV